MSARDDYAEMYRLTIGVGVEDIEDAEAQADQALDEIDRLRAAYKRVAEADGEVSAAYSAVYFEDERSRRDERHRRIVAEAELKTLRESLIRADGYTGLHCCRERSCGCWDGRAVIEHLQEAYDELSNEAQEVRERWRAGVDKMDATRHCFYDEQTATYVARSFHAHYESMAPAFGYTTRQASNVPWAEVPETNRLLMVATAGHVLRDLLDLLDLGANP